MMKLRFVYIYIAIVVVLGIQSCEKMTYSDPTHMEDYVGAPEFTPDFIDNFTDFSNWSYNEEVDEGYYSITNEVGANIFPMDFGVRFEAGGHWCDQRVERKGFVISEGEDFNIEFKMRLVKGTGDAAWQKSGIFIGEPKNPEDSTTATGNDKVTLWLTIENPFEANRGRVNRCIHPVPHDAEWFNMAEGQFDQFDWHVIRATRTNRNVLTIYLDGTEINKLTDPAVETISGKVGLSGEVVSGDFEYLTVNGVTDDFSDMSIWWPLDNNVKKATAWTINDVGLNVVAPDGWNHRAVADVVVAQDFTAEIKVKWNSSSSRFPKAGLFVGDLGGDAPSLVLGLDNNVDVNNGNSIVKFIQGHPESEWYNAVPQNFDISQWHILRARRIGDSMYMYIDGVRFYFETGAHISNIHGKFGILAEGCDVDIEYISFKAE